MTFKYYIVDMAMGEVFGTDDEELARVNAENDECFVIEPGENKWLMTDGESYDIPNVEKSDD